MTEWGKSVLEFPVSIIILFCSNGGSDCSAASTVSLDTITEDFEEVCEIAGFFRLMFAKKPKQWCMCHLSS